MHLVFNGPSNVLKLYDATGTEIFHAECHNQTVGTEEYGPGFFGHYGACPPGEYSIGQPIPLDPQEVSEGAFFIPVIDVHGLWVRYGRSDIGIHGGGTGLADSFAPSQGWVVTLGCFRLQNVDLQSLVGHIKGWSGIVFSVFQGQTT